VSKLIDKHTKKSSAALSINVILQELKEELQNRYGKKLKGVLLFGSYARGEQKVGSDIDIAIILDDFSHACTEIERTGDIVSSISLKFDTLISLVPIKEKDWHKRKTTLISNIKHEGVAI
jgi:predicted nucleotidyltransferase